MIDRSSNQRPSRVSIASGIYEEMKLVSHHESKSNISDPTPSGMNTPPPLPPRVRVNTLPECEIPRSYTNPETETFKKAKLTFKSVFRSRSSSKTDKKTPEKKEEVILRHSKYKQRKAFLENKRNSYSTPDLTKFNYSAEESFEEFDYDAHHSTSGSDRITSGSDHNTSLNESCCYDSPKPINISYQIGANFNASCLESSTINLVGANIILDEKGEDQTDSSVYEEKVVLRKKSIDNEVGYIVMKAPNIRNAQNFVTLDRCFDIQFTFEDIVSSSTLPQPQKSAVYANVQENNYVDMTLAKSPNKDYDSPRRIMEESVTSNTTQKSNRNSFDEKVPSYYPNPNSYKVKENLYITTPKIIARKMKSKSAETKRSKSISPPKIIIEKSSTTSPSKSSSLQNITTHSPFAQRIYQKYATLTLSRSLKGKNSVEKIEATRKFGSLPRFRRFDFSPLKLKINSVLNRQQNVDI